MDINLIYWVVGMVVGILTLFISLWMLAFKLGRWQGEVNKGLSNLNQNFEQVNRNFEQIRNEIQTDRENSSRAFAEIRNDMKTDRENSSRAFAEIRNDIKHLLSRLPCAPLAPGSPKKLTELGKQISADVDANAWAEAEAAAFFEQIMDKDKFEIQSIAFEHAQSFEPSAALLASMRASAYERGMDLPDVRKVLGVALRDHLA